MAKELHPIVYAVKKVKDKQARRQLIGQRLVVADIYLNKKSIKKLIKLIA